MKKSIPILLHFMKLSLMQVILALVYTGITLAHGANAQELLNQRVSVRIENQSLRKVFKEIESITHIRFAFRPREIPFERKMTVIATNESLAEVLDKVVKPLKLRYEVVGRQIVISSAPSVGISESDDQTKVENRSPEPVDKNISGLVTSETGEGLPGVSVVVKNTTRGTTTDANGKFTITVPDEAPVLVFSFVGYAPQEIAVGSQSVLEIKLTEDKKSLEEVVVVGYGAQSKRIVTGAISRVNMSVTETLPNTNITQALRGRVAGVQILDTGRPGQEGTVLIRGPRSLSGSNNPLIVLDGIIFGGSLSDINPNDIKSLDILKDASASAIYGSRAANGVILITSKGGVSEKPTISFNAFAGVSDRNRDVQLFNLDRYVQSKLDWRKQSGLDADPAKILTYLTKTEAENYSKGISHDPWEEAFQKAGITSYDLSISGRSKATNYYLSASMVNEKGIVYNDNVKRTSFRANITNTVTSWLTVGLNSTYVRRDLSGINASISQAYNNSPLGTWYHPDGQPKKYIVDEDQVSSNSIYDAKMSDNKEVNDNLFSNFFAEVTVPFIDGLSYRVNYSPNFRWGQNYTFFKQDKYLTNNTTSASKINTKSFDWVLENILTYSRRIGTAHAIDATFLYGRNHQEMESTTARGSQLTLDALGYNDLNLASVREIASTARALEGISSMARLNYRFRDKYLLTLTARRDASSVFSVNHKYATFPSAALAWIASDEEFIRKLNFLDMLKVRLSYGAVGNQGIDPYQSLSLSAITQYVFGNGGPTSTGVYPSTIGNQNLKWETTYTTNFAIDFELFKRRVGGTLELYTSKTTDLLVNRSIPTMTGYNNILTNIGEINNRGVELSLNTSNINSAQFQWTTDLSFSNNRNRIISLYGTDLNGDGKEDDDIANNWFIGHPITSYFDYTFNGIYQQGDEIPSGSQPGFVRLKDLNNDGVINASDRSVVGSGGQPRFRIGITNNFSYGNWSFSFLVNSMLGWQSNFPLLNTAVSPNAPGRGINQLDAGYWTEENRSNTRPSLVYNNPLKHGWYVSRNFVRLQDISLSYTFPARLLKPLYVSNLRAYVAVKNAHVFTHWPGSDPESGGRNVGELFPMPRTFSAGINLGF
ncbi:TonB-dependent receptor [Larkinella bovis]|uniref:TonB-dependent receptor n=1 Tax=Larkinella bovis TaxID=683041 RepID=A0ABW0II88_9BACT